jgi:hypothetical protein
MCSFLEAFVQRTWQAEVHKHAFSTFSRPTVAPVLNKLVGRPMSTGCFSGHLFGNQNQKKRTKGVQQMRGFTLEKNNMANVLQIALDVLYLVLMTPGGG